MSVDKIFDRAFTSVDNQLDVTMAMTVDSSITDYVNRAFNEDSIQDTGGSGGIKAMP